MGRRHGNVALKGIFAGVLLALAGLAAAARADTLDLEEAPLSQVISLYAKETGRNVFVDDTVQQQRRVTAHLRDMAIGEGFAIIQKTIGLESTLIGTNTLMLFPPERASRYRAGARPLLLRLPPGIDARWVSGVLGTLLTGVRAAAAEGDPRALLVFGPEPAVGEARGLLETLPALAQARTTEPMSEAEARLALREVDGEGVVASAGPAGLVWQGPPAAVRVYGDRVRSWRQAAAFGSEVFTPEHLDPARALKAAEAARGRVALCDLGGTGALLLEGPAGDRARLLAILTALDRQERRVRQEVALGDLSVKAAREALEKSGVGVEGAGDRRLVLVGRRAAVGDAAEMLTMLGRPRRQVAIGFRLAEVARSRLKALGIELDKNLYTYEEIKGYHPKDTLPLLLRALHEGKGSRILAEPNLRVLEGEEARVLIGDKIPLEVAATAQTEAGSTLKLNAQLSWVDVGIKLTVKDVRVGPDGSVQLALGSEVSTVVATTKQGYPQIRTREAQSLLRVGDGGTVVLGGLLSREERETASKIPFVGNIPLFGGLARGTDRKKEDTDILMVVTASVLPD